MPTINLSKETHETVKALTSALLMSQSEVIDFLIKETFAEDFIKKAISLKDEFLIHIQIKRAESDAKDISTFENEQA